MKSKIDYCKGTVRRHSITEMVVHWSVAISGLILMVSGLFQLPIAKRYYITELMAWSGDFFFTLKLHYAAAIIFVGASFFHIVYHALLKETGMLPKRGDMLQSIKVILTFFGKGEEPPFEKYLPEQRLAYVGMAAIIGVLIISGLVKSYKNLYNPQIGDTILSIATWAHNIGFLLFFLAFIAHIGALLLKPNRPMIRSMFSGKVDLEYAKERHPLWMDEIEK